jgi:hypothetical protein
MKRTAFEFELRPIAQDVLQPAIQALESIKGVERVEQRGAPFGIGLLVHAAFLDGNEAKKLHRKVIRSITKSKSIVVASATSNLSEIYD